MNSTAEAERIAALEAECSRLRLALTASSLVGGWDWDVPSDRVYADERCARLYSVDPARAAAGESIAAFLAGVDPADRPWLGARIQAAVASGEDFAEEYRVRPADGAVAWVLARGRCRHDAEGRPLRFSGVVLDITARKQAEGRLAESEERCRLATEAAAIGIWDYDPGTSALDWDARVRRLFGVSDDRTVRLDDFWAALHADDRPAVEAAMQAAFDPGGSGEFEAEYRAIGHDDGITRWLVAKGRARFEEGRVVRFLGTVRDISDAKRTQASLSAETHRLAIINRTGRMLSAELDLARLVQSATDAGLALAEATFGAFLHAEPQRPGQDIVFAGTGSAAGAEPAPATRAFLRPLSARLHHLGNRRVADLAEAPDAVLTPVVAALPAAAGLRSALAVPVISRAGAPLGCFLFGHAAPAAFDDDDEKLIAGMAAQVAIAIDNARLYQAAQSEIAERRQVEAALRAAEASIRIAVKAAKLGRFDHDPSGGRRFWDRRTKEILGLHAGADLSFEDFLALVHPADRAQVQNALATALDPAGPGMLHAEFRTLPPGHGDPVWIEASGAAFFERGRCIRFTGVIADVTERKRTEQHLRLLVNELNHRVKNSLAIVQAVALQTLRDPASLAEARHRFTERLVALARAHDVLTQENWEGADLKDVVEQAVATYLGQQHPRLRCAGPRVRLSPKAALALSMATHELCANAVEHGALTGEAGRVDLVWSLHDTAGGRRLDLVWRESGGPVVAQPSRKGFGSKLIERGLAAELDGEVAIDYAPDGVVCTVRAPLDVEDREIE